MALHLDAPKRVTVRFATDSDRDRPRLAPSVVLDVVVRGLLTGVGAALVLVAGDRVGIVSVTAVGVLALGAALVEWDH
jgi:hypothetical protein